ncbi:hypothetical protein H5410_031224, partial [Solanum commersonii]
MWEGIVKESHLLDLSNLQEFSVGMKLGTEFPHWLKDQNELNNIIFNTTGISNVVADWFVKLDLKLDNLDMAYNNLTGKVPKAQISSQLVRVDSSLARGNNEITVILSVRNNKFLGHISFKVCSLSGLHILDLSINNLCGSILSCFGNLEGFKVELTHNKLTGNIPTSTQFQTKVDPIIFQGNVALCGPPLSECVGDGTTTTSQSRRNDEGKTDDEDKLKK